MSEQPGGEADLRRLAEVRIDALCDRFERQWQAGAIPRLEDFLPLAHAAERETLLRELLGLELDYRVRAGETPAAQEYHQRLPGYEAVVEGLFATVALTRGPGSATPLASVLVAESLPERAGRYRIDGEVARGGMGCVLRAHDPELKRPLAVKILLARHKGNARIERRFLEEARITGQLQHPAIPPVHEVGRLADGRPFFAMKLIKGRTLADLLEDRSSPKEDLPRWVTAFGSVCQGVAAAHAQGVIHRDLKPANIMVGAFGEVQVMDWGLAKVLPSGGPQPSEEPAERSVIPGRAGDASTWSQDGDILGTPAYMPPEQARGEIDSLDARSDVFGLGAILCVILTGQPPYRGGGQQVRRQAESGDLSEAFARLSGCGADAELVALARSCLAPVKEERPPDASAVARSLSAYQMGVEQRLRQAELEAAAAVVKAGEERKRRRLGMGLAAMVTLALVSSTAAALYWQMQQRRAREQAEVGLEQAIELRQGYRFEDAAAMLKQVRGWANQAADSRLQRRLTEAETDLALTRDLDRIRQEAATLVEGKWDPGRVRDLYPKLLARHGLDVLEDDPDELAQRIKLSSVRENIVAALDDWAKAEKDSKRRERLLRLANLADQPEPWRQAARQALARGDERRLRHLLRRQGNPTVGVVLLLWELFRHQNEEVTALLRRMQMEQPRDFWVNTALGIRLAEQGKHHEEVECFRAAVALRPDSASARYDLGIALSAVGKSDDAITCYKKALEIDSRFVWAHVNLGVASRNRGKNDEAIAHFKRAIEIDPGYAPAHTNLGIVLRAWGKLDEAIACHKRAIEIAPTFAAAHLNLGAALLAKKKADEAIRCCNKALALDPQLAPAHTNIGIALRDKGKMDEAIACFRKAVAIDSRFAPAQYQLGRALRTRGKVDEAIECFRKAVESNPGAASAHHELAQSLESRGRIDEAIACYKKSIAINPGNAAAYHNLGNALMHDKSNLKQAIACFEKALAIKPRLAEAHTALGNTWHARGKLDEAIACHKRAIEIDSRNATAYNNLGGARHARGELDEAIVCFRKVIELNPRLPDGHYNLAIALRDKRKTNEAITCYKRTLELAPRHAKAHTNLGVALREKGQLDEAIGCFRKAVLINPRLVEALANLADTLQDTGKGDEAIECYKKLLAINPQDVAAQSNLGLALEAKGKVDEAIACYKKAIAIEPRAAKPHYNLGRALRARGQFRDALTALRRSIALAADSDAIRPFARRLSRQCQQLIDTDAQLKAFLAGKGAPADAPTQLRIAMLAQEPFNRYYLAAARLYRDAFARQPALAADARYNAACCAVLAACGRSRGADRLDGNTRATWRLQGLTWLRADLAVQVRQLKGRLAKQVAQARQNLENAQRDPDLAGVRNREALIDLPEAERLEWHKVWDSVAIALRQAGRADNAPHE